MPIDLQLRIRIQLNAALISIISDEILFESSILFPSSSSSWSEKAISLHLLQISLRPISRWGFWKNIGSAETLFENDLLRS